AVFISKEAADKMHRFLRSVRKKHKFIIGINPSANWKLKRWPAANFAYVADKLIEQLKCAVFFIGTDKDNKITEQVLKHMHHTSYNMCGKTTVSELAALMKSFSLFLSNDSGPAHLAASLNIPTFILFGPTSSQLTAPRSKAVKIICSNAPKKPECKIPCYNLKCKDNICMKNISVNEVLTQIRNELLKKHV
ncbi:MAG: glycosyltransferase family 9 protein, partial [Candidatus Omnitrophota bacterium]